jgi:hypothetical protein
MSLQIPIAFVTQYKANILMLSQQKQPKLRMACRPESCTGEKMMVERLGPKDAQKRTTRHGATPVSDADHTRRLLVPADYDVPADIIDKPDKLRLLIDPQSSYAQNQVFSLNRVIDDIVIDALWNTRYGGHDGTTAINMYDVGESRIIAGDGTVIAAGSNDSGTTETCLTIAKLLTAKQLLDDAEIDDERQRYFLTNPYNINQLLNTTEVKSADYNTVKALAQGQIDTFMGFKFLKSTRLPISTTDTGTCRSFAFAQDAVVLSVMEEPTVNVDPRYDLCGSVQVYSTMTGGAVVVEGPAVVEVLLKNAA